MGPIWQEDLLKPLIILHHLNLKPFLKPHPLPNNYSSCQQKTKEMMMAFTTTPYKPCFLFFSHQTKPTPPPFALSCNFSPIPLSFSYNKRSRIACAAKQQTGSTKKRIRKKKSSEEAVYLEDAAAADDSESEPSSIPKPPAGFILDSNGRVLAASSKRIVTIVDSGNNMPLECVVRRVFRSSRGDDCMLLCPVDTPVQILKSKNFDGWAAVSDEEIEAILPSAAYALAKIHMHLVLSGFCYTARGGFCYSEEDILEFQTDDGEGIDGLPTEGIEITCFNQDGSHYMIYTPSDPLLFVAAKDENGLLKIADDDLLEDPAIIGAIDEETEFNALVEEESALLESLLGER